MAIKQEKFKVLNLIKDLIVYIDNKMVAFPKRDIELKHKIVETAQELLLDTYKANNTTDPKVRIYYQDNCIAYIKFLDFMFNICYEKEIINAKKYYKLGEKLELIVRYIVGWKNTTLGESKKTKEESIVDEKKREFVS